MKSFCIIGLGKFGIALANALVDAGKQVMVIDVDTEKVTEIADNVTNAVIGDASNMNLLKASGVADYDCAVVCMTSNISDIILVTIQLKELGVKHVIARAVNEGHKKVLEHVGADEIVYPEHDMGERLAFKLSITKCRFWPGPVTRSSHPMRKFCILIILPKALLRRTVWSPAIFSFLPLRRICKK